MAKTEIVEQDLAAPEEVVVHVPAVPVAGIDTEGINRAILSNDMNRYDLVCLARRWAYELVKENPNLSVQKLIETAVQDILSSKVSIKMIQELPKLAPKKVKSVPMSGTQESVDATTRAEKRSK